MKNFIDCCQKIYFTLVLNYNTSKFPTLDYSLSDLIFPLSYVNWDRLFEVFSIKSWIAQDAN